MLGRLWEEICDENMRGEHRLISMGLNHRRCQEMVRKKWKNSDLANLVDSIDDLLNACPSNDDASHYPTTVGTWDEGASKNLQQLLNQKCVSCHTSSISYSAKQVIRMYFNEKGEVSKEDAITTQRVFPPIVPNRLSVTLLMEIYDSVRLGRMPLSGTLTKDEKEMIKTIMEREKIRAVDRGEKIEEIYRPLRGEFYSKEKVDELLALFGEVTKFHPTEESLQYNRRRILCAYRQEGCPSLIEYMLDNDKIVKLPDFVKSAIDEPTRENMKLFLKCHFVFDVTSEECAEINMDK